NTRTTRKKRDRHARSRKQVSCLSRVSWLHGSSSGSFLKPQVSSLKSPESVAKCGARRWKGDRKSKRSARLAQGGAIGVFLRFFQTRRGDVGPARLGKGRRD